MPLVRHPVDVERRHAFVIGTPFSPPGLPDIEQGVREEMAAVERLLLDTLGYQRETYRSLLNPTQGEVKTALSDWRIAIAPTAEDWLLVYYTGHGVDSGGMLRLITKDGTRAETALSAQDLLFALLGTEELPAHSLIIFDTCRSGAAHLDTAAIALRLQEEAGGRGTDVHVIASAHSIGDATVSRFVAALRTTLAKGPLDDEYVHVSAATKGVNTLLEEQRANYFSKGEGTPHFFPNPGWGPRLRPNMERSERARVLNRIQAQAKRTHWSPRARGVATDDQPGWFFTGRKQAITDIVKWLSTGTASRGLLVRGLPGSGKSAVLARIATLADSECRLEAEKAGALANTPAAELPPPEIVDVAVHAREKDGAQLALEIGAALELDLSGLSADPEVAIVSALSRCERPLLILVDALDESHRPAYTASFLQGVLGKAPNVRLLVGLRESNRGELSELLSPVFTAVDLDLAPWREPNDVVCYVKTYLLKWPASPYAKRVDVVDDLAHAIAERVGTSFQVASMAAHALAAHDSIMTAKAVKALFKRLPSGVGAVLELDLKRFPGVSGERLRSILTALAYAPAGTGMPLEEWRAVATSLHGTVISTTELERWRHDAGSYVVQDEEFGTPVWRLYHEDLATRLAQLRREDAEKHLPEALLTTVRKDEAGDLLWESASSWLLAYYVRYLSLYRNSEDAFAVACSEPWMAAKRSRFNDLTAVLADLDGALEAARGEGFPNEARVIDVCIQYARLRETGTPVAMAIPETARKEGHLKCESLPEADSDLAGRVMEYYERYGYRAGLAYMSLEKPSARGRAMTYLEIAKYESSRDRELGRSLWLEALIASRLCGEETLNHVLAARALSLASNSVREGGGMEGSPNSIA